MLERENEGERSKYDNNDANVVSKSDRAHLKKYHEVKEQQRKQRNYVTCNNNACNDHNINTK